MYFRGVRRTPRKYRVLRYYLDLGRLNLGPVHIRHEIVHISMATKIYSYFPRKFGQALKIVM